MQNLLRLLLGTTPPGLAPHSQMDPMAYRSFEGGNHLGTESAVSPICAQSLSVHEDEHPYIVSMFYIEKRKPAHRGRVEYLAEEVGFEPTRAFTLLVFKTSAFNHSAIPPKRIEGYHIRPPFEALRKERLPLHDKPGERSPLPIRAKRTPVAQRALFAWVSNPYEHAPATEGGYGAEYIPYFPAAAFSPAILP